MQILELVERGRGRPLGGVRFGALSGIVGPVVFTAAWFGCGLRQEGRGGYTFRREHISGLGAPDAECPRAMAGAFAVLGASLFPFASAVGRSLERAAGPVPLLLRVAGAAAVVAGLMRRDRMLLGPPPGDPGWRQSWRNDVHDAASGVAYGCMLLIPVALGWASRRDQKWGRLSRPAALLFASTTMLGVLFTSRRTAPYGGVAQRLMVSVSLTAVATFAAGLLVDAGGGEKGGTR
jgi:hypothetical protein